MPTKPLPPADPTTLAPFKEIMRKEKAYPAEAYVAALKRLDELTKQGITTNEEVKESLHCARTMAICLATYRVMPEIFESTLAFPGFAYIQGNSSKSSRPKDAPNLLGHNRKGDYIRAPRPDDA